MPRVLVVGDVINDILAVVRGPLRHGADNPATIRTRAGGSAANQAAWLASLGLDVAFAGRAGAADAAFHRQELARFGVEPHVAADDFAPTGSIVVLTGPDGERTMITSRGANLNLCQADVPAALLDGADLLHLTGYTLFESGTRAVARGLIAEAGRRGIPFTVDPGSAAFLAALGPGEFLAWTSTAAVCFPNRDEAVVLAGQQETGMPGTGITDPESLAAQLARHYGVVALKLGADGAIIAAAGETEPLKVPAIPVPVRDTTGAGDAFCAGFLAAWLAGAGLKAAAAAGTGAASTAVSVLGGRPEPDPESEPEHEDDE
ncbi:MAG TPA: PfkB family carbohydrate kinase [Trebonia sp.]|nr:PfkB family carbohydrate kinase [Trebonia sp.]